MSAGRAGGGGRAGSLAHLTLARAREFYREPEAVFWVFIFPMLLAAGLGLAFRNRAPETVRAGLVVDARPGAPDPCGEEAPAADRPAARCALAGAMARRDERVRWVRVEERDAIRALSTGDVALLVDARGDSLEYRYDDTREESRAARLVVDDLLQRGSGRRDAVPTADRIVRERGSRYIDFVVPGLLGMNIMGSGIWGIGFAIVDQRRKRLLKRLLATPMSRTEYLLSFVLFRFAVLVLETVALLGFAALVFDVPMRGSFVLLALVSVVAALAFSALGLLVASRVQTVEGASGLSNLIMLPMWIFSGVFFSSANFPDAMQPAIQALPLTAAIDALRANMLRGAGWAELGGEMAILAGWTLASFVLAMRLFRWR